MRDVSCGASGCSGGGLREWPWVVVEGSYVICRGLEHRRRIELEDKAKVVASDWGQNPCRTSCFASVYLKQSVEFTEL